MDSLTHSALHSIAIHIIIPSSAHDFNTQIFYFVFCQTDIPTYISWLDAQRWILIHYMYDYVILWLATPTIVIVMFITVLLLLYCCNFVYILITFMRRPSIGFILICSYLHTVDLH
jgi:hypothetical protein